MIGGGWYEDLWKNARPLICWWFIKTFAQKLVYFSRSRSWLMIWKCLKIPCIPMQPSPKFFQHFESHMQSVRTFFPQEFQVNILQRTQPKLELSWQQTSAGGSGLSWKETGSPRKDIAGWWGAVRRNRAKMMSQRRKRREERERE